MTPPDPLVIRQSAPPALHLFRIDPGFAQARTLAEAPTPAILAAALGLPHLPPNSAEVIRLADVTALGLRDFLVQGHDVQPGVLGPQTDWLDALDGHILVLHPSLTHAGDVTLYPCPGLSLLGAFALAAPAPTPLHLPEAERPVTMGAPPSTPAMPAAKGSAMLIILLALIAALIALGLRFVIGWPA